MAQSSNTMVFWYISEQFKEYHVLPRCKKGYFSIWKSPNYMLLLWYMVLMSIMMFLVPCSRY